MLHGVDKVVVKSDDDEVFEYESDGRAYMWSNGAVTIYFKDSNKPWVIMQANKLVCIVGKEHG